MTRRTTVRGTAADRALIALVLLAPLAFGAAPSWGWATLAVGVAALLLANAVQPGPPATALPVWALAGAAALAVLALWQAFAAWPAHPLRLDAAGGGVAVEPAAALDPDAARAALVRLASYAGVAWLAARCAAARSTRPVLAAIVAAAALYAAYALAVRAAGLDGVLWLGRSAYDAASGPFISRGAFAAFCGLAMLAAVARVAGARTPWRRWALAAAWLLLAAALLASRSRAGLAAALAGHAVLLVLLVRQGALPRRAAVAAAVLLPGAVALAALATGLDSRMLAAPEDLAQRVAIWRVALAAAADRPWLGHGLGSFPDLFDLYRPDAVGRPARTAHSGPLEWAAEAGLPAALAWHALLAGLALRCLRAVRLGRRDPAPALAAAVMTLVAVQGAIDFAPQVPAVALLAALLLGLGLGRSSRRRPDQRFQ